MAKARGWKVEETGFFAADEPILALGAPPQVSAEIFALKEGDVSAPLRVGRGYAIAALAGRQDPAIPKLDDVKDRVRNDVLREKAGKAASAKAASVAAALKIGGRLRGRREEGGRRSEVERARRARRGAARCRRERAG